MFVVARSPPKNIQLKTIKNFARVIMSNFPESAGIYIKTNLINVCCTAINFCNVPIFFDLFCLLDREWLTDDLKT